MNYTITEDFTGGNITVVEISETKAEVRINYRDSEPWCYWAFKVSGASGKTITFNFGEDAVGYCGAAVSHDLKNWHWSHPDDYRDDEKDRESFTYTFADGEDEVYFAHNMLYNPSDFENVDFMEKYILCNDFGDIPVPMATMGEGEDVILMTARHHACEAPANYVLEGCLKELFENSIEGYKIIAVPFVDMKGVVCGDQGKGRKPHDHNRDYNEESLYPTVGAIKELLNNENVKYVFDFHSPCHLGSGNDSTSLVNAYECLKDEMLRLSKLFASEMTDDCFKFRDGRITWRDEPLKGTFSAYSGGLGKVDFVCTIENPYFGEPGNIMTQQNYLETGRAFGRAMKKFIETKSEM
ncbi:MAG: hypothetical protein IJB70_07140 [Clostridia bacterium]|nr:hypothetical protein [Clostridia bacterium]